MTQPEPSPLTAQLRVGLHMLQAQLDQLSRAVTEIESMVAGAEQRITDAQRRQHAAERQAQLTEEKRRQQVSASPKLLVAAAAFLLKNEEMTTEQFALGADREESAALREILESLGAVESREIQHQEEDHAH